MSHWDSAALTHLENCVDLLHEDGLVAVLHDVVTEVGHRNARRFDPGGAGDTTRLFGLMCSENVARLAARRLTEYGVRTSWAEHTLTIHAAGLRISARKAPDDGPVPVWSAITWEESDGHARHAGAAANSLAYHPADQDLRQQVLELELEPASATDAAALTYSALVYTVEPTTGLTSGWLTLPSVGRPTFFAVTALWRDGPPDLGSVTCVSVPTSVTTIR